MKQQVAEILASILLICLTAGAQEGGWDASMDAGKAAMAKHQYAEAEAYFRKALAAAGHFQHGEEDARFSATLLFLAQTCDAESKRDEAETLAQRAADAMETAFKAYKPAKAEDQLYESDVAAALFDKVGDIFAGHQNFAEAERSYQRVVKIRAAAVAAEEDEEKNRPPQNNEDFLRLIILTIAANSQGKLLAADEKLAKTYFTEHKFEEAAAMYEQARQIREKSARPSPDEVNQEAVKQYLAKHPEKIAGYERASQSRAEAERGAQHDLALTLSNLASCYAAQAKYDKAEPLYQRALKLFDQANWAEKPETLSTMQFYALLLRKTGREEESKAILEKVAAIRKKLQQPQNP